jgi:hypothetical protein
MVRRSSGEQLPAAGEAIQAHVIDISCGGALVRPVGGRSDFREGDAVGTKLFLSDGKPPVEIEAKCRGRRKIEDGEMAIAVQFEDLFVAPDGRQVLERVAGCVQRFHRVASLSGSRM